MNALSDLAAEVKFRERMRGYDYEEVDSYVKSVSRAASQAQERIAELENRVAQLEPEAGKDEGVTEIRETLLRTLVLAQRTADSAVAEARSEAKSITDSAKERAAKTVSEAEAAANERLRSAEERAARMLAESEENGQTIVAEAKRMAAAELATEREQAQEEIRDLEASKDALETLVAEIQARLDADRDMLRSLSVSFQSFVEKFEPAADVEESVDGYGVSEGPALLDGDDSSDGDTDEERADHESAPEAAEAVEDPPDDLAADAGTDGAPAGADPESVEGASFDFLPADDETPQGFDALQGDPAPDAVGTGAVPEPPVVGWDEEIDHDPQGPPDGAAISEPHPAAPGAAAMEPAAGGNGSAHGEREDSTDGDEAAFAGPPTMPVEVDSPELFDMDAEEDDEFIEQLRQVVSSDAPLPDTEAAMAAFFDHDEAAGPERPVSAANKGGTSGTRSGAASRGGRLGPRA